jgi:DNA (cytosine-5)-methyltransferase 1
MKKINHLDLFSGIGGFHLGFERAGFKINSFFSEIDKHAIAVYKHKFPKSTYVGSVTNVRGGDLPRIDLITFGSPCQDFSLAGKRAGMGGDRSSLILEAIRLIGECRPRVFIWENVKGTFSSNAGEDFAAIIQEFANIGGYQLEWQLLNTSWFLPQNRERIYLVGYSTTPKRGWRGVFPIRETNEKNNRTSSKQHNATINPTICTNYWRFANDTPVLKVKQIGTKFDSNGGTQPYQQDRVYDADGYAPALNQGKSDLIVKVKSATSNGYEEATVGDSINLSNPNSETRRGRVGSQRAQTLETSCNQAVVEPMIGIGIYGNNKETQYQKEVTRALALKASNQSNPRSGGTTLVGEPIIVAQRGRYNEDGTTSQQFEPNQNGTTNTLTAVQKDNMVTDGYRIRRLTPIECERLQGFPDDHTSLGNYDGETKPMSNTQRYKQCGNAVTVDVVEAVAKRCIPLL